MNVLLIDDDENRASPLYKYLTLIKRWEVEWATSPTDALLKLKKPDRPFNVIILDIMMPEDDAVKDTISGDGYSTGLVLLEQIKELIKDPTQIAILSARGDVDYLLDNKEVDYCFQKPLFPEELVEKLTQGIGPTSE